MATELERLPRLIERAVASLEKATSAAQILEARDQADIAYTAAKLAARLSKIKDAHDTVLSACRKTMADALVIESRAQCRLADEYDAAQKRGEIATRADGPAFRDHIPKGNKIGSVGDIGLTSKQVHEARIVRDAEKAKPGIVRKTVEERLQSGGEPTHADVRRAVVEHAPKPKKAKAKAADVMPTKEECDAEWQQDLYEQACALVERMTSATRAKFIAYIKRRPTRSLPSATRAKKNATATAAHKKKSAAAKRDSGQPSADDEAEQTRLGVCALIEEITDYRADFSERVREFLQTHAITPDGAMHLHRAIFMASQDLIALSNEAQQKR